MKRRLLLAAVLAAFRAGAVSAASTGPVVSIYYPDEGYSMPFLKQTFILGVATPTPGVLTVNGAAVTQYKNGAFIAFLPVAPGTFTFHAEYHADDGTSAVLDRKVAVGKPLLPSTTATKGIDPDYTLPAQDAGLQPGDWLQVQVKGPIGRRARYELPGAGDWRPLIENSQIPGLYQASLPITAAMDARAARVRFDIDNGFWSSLDAESPGRVTAPATARVVETVSEQPPVRTAPGEGYMLLPAKGTRFVADGLQGGFVRLRLSPDQAGWVAKDLVRFLPEGTPPPQAVLGTLHTAAYPRETRIALELSEQAPYAVEEVDGGLSLRLYNTAAHVNTIIYDSSDTFVTAIRARQESSRTVVISVRLDPKTPLWGWHASYESGQMVLVLRRPPAMKPYGHAPLKGLTIALDPGHSPGVHGDGAIGPTGVTEATVNLAIAEQLRDLLAKDGADVVMTREGQQNIGLPERVQLAWDRRADLYISIHNNALPDGANPFVPGGHGFMVFYYHKHSQAFAAAMHDAYRESSPLPDEGLRYGNLLVARESGMPAILTESEYMIYPEREEALMDPVHQKALAHIHRAGILAFLRSLVPEPAPEPRKKLSPTPPTERKAAPAAKPAAKSVSKSKKKARKDPNEPR